MGIRVLAAILALGAFLWGFPAMMLVYLGQGLVVLPGYLLLIFYVTRWMAVPPHWVRYLGWSLSLLIQGAWLIWAFWSLSNFDSRAWAEAWIFLTWWCGACLASAWSLAFEHRVPTESDIPPIFRRPKSA